MEVAYVWVEKENPVNAFGRTEIMTRVLVLLILLATPWALALDTAQLQQWGQIPDFYLPDYLTLQFSENQTWQKVQTWQLPNATWHGPKEYFLHMTRPRWPDLASATNSMARAKFWVLFMTIKLVGTTVFAVLVQMQQDEGVGDDRSQNQLKDVQRTSITICLVVANLAFCTKLTLTASMAGQLTSGGMVWEGFDEILSWGLLWLLAQAMALRLLNCNAVYATIDVALSTLFVFPYLGDPFDTLKDAMLASVAIESDVLWLKYLGIAGLIYLWVLHLCVLLPVKSSRLELQSSYVPVLLLKPTRTGSEFEHSMWVKLCIVMYKQTTPTRQKAMLAEDLPQALLAFVVSMSSKGSLFTVVANIAMPLARLSLAVWYHDSLAEAVKDWLLEQAVETFCYDRVEASNEFTVVMSRLAQVTGKDDIWESHLLQEAKDRVNEKWEQVAHMAGEVRSLEEGAAFPAYLQLQLALKGLEQGTTEWQGKALVNLLKMALGDPSWQGICSQVSSGLGPKLTAMEDLKLSRHDFTDEGAQLLADAVSHLTAITKLHLALRYCNITTEGCKAVATGLAKCKNIQDLKLDLHCNTIRDEGAEALADAITHLTAITKLHLNLDYCNITTEGCKAVATGLAKCKNIQDLKLDLQSNTIQGAKALADAITHLTAITKLHLDLNYCKITGEGCKAIATSLAKMTNIQDLKLDLQSNAIRDEGAKALADAISHLTAITKLHLDLWHCNITSDGCKAIATALPKLTNIQELKLDLHGNAIGDEGCRALAEHLPQLQELVMLELYLHGNRLSSAAGAALEEAGAELPHLTVKTMKWFW
eukprot:Skav205470  [mRNA]  locus=scaffold830:34640:37556:+ [translate_table: standard]